MSLSKYLGNYRVTTQKQGPDRVRLVRIDHPDPLADSIPTSPEFSLFRTRVTTRKRACVFDIASQAVKAAP